MVGHRKMKCYKCTYKPATWGLLRPYKFSTLSLSSAVCPSSRLSSVEYLLTRRPRYICFRSVGLPLSAQGLATHGRAQKNEVLQVLLPARYFGPTSPLLVFPFCPTLCLMPQTRRPRYICFGRVWIFLSAQNLGNPGRAQKKQVLQVPLLACYFGPTCPLLVCEFANVLRPLPHLLLTPEVGGVSWSGSTTPGTKRSPSSPSPCHTNSYTYNWPRPPW